MAKILTFAAWKGGVGKTTMVFNLSVLNETKRILIIDVDPQCNLSNSFLHKHWENNCIHEPIPLKTDFKNIEIIPSNINLINRWDLLDCKKLINKFSNNYDYIIFDTPPTLNKEVIDIFDLSNEIYLITDASSVSFTGLLTTIAEYREHQKIINVKDNLKGIILNNLNRFKLTNEFIEDIKNNPATRRLVVEPFIYKWSSIYKTLIFKESIKKMHDKKASDILLELSIKLIK